MTFAAFFGRAARSLVLVSFVATGLASGVAMAQAEPTLAQVYAAAQSGKIADAQLMIQQVLITHPNSAKALFIQSELYAKQGDMTRAKSSLAQAEKLAPGLPFAKPEAVQALRAELTSRPAASASKALGTHEAATTGGASSSSSSSWGLPVLLAVGVIAAGYFMFRRRAPQAMAAPAAYAQAGGMGAGPQAWGRDAGGMAQPPVYGQPGYGQAGYGQPAAAPGMGSRIAGGLATGLAVGAGVMAAEAIGRNLMGNREHGGDRSSSNDHIANYDDAAIQRNADMGGQNFGVNDAGSWDDAGGGGFDGGGDWDN